MDFATVVLYFYLMFPVFSPQQSELIYKFGKKELTLSQKTAIQTQIRNYLFPSENISEITQPETVDIQELLREEENLLDEESLIFEDGIPLPDDLENPKFGPQSAGSDLLENAEDEQQEGIKSIAEEQFINSMNRLSLFKYGEEQFAINEKNSNKRNLVTVNKDTVIRVRYDEDFYIKDKIVWKNASSLKDSVIISKVNYEYTKNKTGKVIVSKIEEYPGERKFVNTVYDENGNPITVIYSHIEEDKDEYEKLVAAAKEKFADENPVDETDNSEIEKENAGAKKSREELEQEYIKKINVPEKRIEDRKIVRTYDSQNRLLSEEEGTVYEVPDPKRRGKKIKMAGSKKNVYTYTPKASVPDYIFYENGKMRIAVNYIDEDTYEQTLYFENEFSVKTRYVHGRKTREIFYSGMNEIKRNEFE